MSQVERQGNHVARAVWVWLHRKLAVQYVPWVTDPKSKDYDAIKAAKQQERHKLLNDLKILMEHKSKDVLSDETPEDA